VVVGILPTAQAGTLRGDAKKTETERIARLIKQLGDGAFAKREAASKELSAIGEPGLAALRKAESGSDDPELRRRAEKLVAAIRLQMVKKALAKLEGTWVRKTAESDGRAAPKDNPAILYVFKGDSVSVKAGDAVTQQAIRKIVDVSGNSIKVDYSISAGVNRGGVVRGNCTLKPDQLRWCYCFGPYDRPTTFATSRETTIRLLR
jgi:uncharacterized protein (TIGR03067 family)